MKNNGNFKEEKMDWWYSRIVSMSEEDYQIVVGILEKEAKTSADVQLQKTLATFKRGQEEHYTSREEYYERMRKRQKKK